MKHIVSSYPIEGNTPEIFRRFNAAIAVADAEGDHLTVNLLLVAKMSAIRYYHELYWGGR